MSDTNGTVTRDQVLEARRRLRLTETQLHQKRLDKLAALHESNSWGDFWANAVTDRIDRFSREPTGLIGRRDARKAGRNWPLVQTEQDLGMFRDRARILVDWNEYAQGLLEGLTSYVLGDGCTYRVSSIDAKRPAPEELTQALQKVIDDFLENNQWHGGEQPGLEEELFRRSCRDGEFFLVSYNDTGATMVRVIEPEQVTQKPGSDSEEYSFGILTPPDDVANHLAYWFQWYDGTGEEFAADRVVHFRRNVDRNIKRGLTDFCGGTLEALHDSSKLRAAMTKGAAIQATYAVIRQHDSASKAEIEDLRTALADFTTTNPNTGTTEYHQKHDVSTLDIPKGLNYVTPPTAQNAASHVQILQACLRGAGRKWCAPEWLASGDSSNNNFASSLVAASDFVKTVTRRQRGYEAAFKRQVITAIKNRVNAGFDVQMIKRDANGNDTGERSERTFTWQEIQRLVNIQVEAPSPVATDVLAEAQATQIHLNLRTVSPQTVMQRQGLDVEQELVNMEEFQERLGDAGLPLPLPPNIFGQAPVGLDTGGQVDSTGTPPENAAEAALDAVATATTPDAAAKALAATVGGSQAIIALQTQYYAGELARDAALANAKILFGFDPATAEQLFPATDGEPSATGRGAPVLPVPDRRQDTSYSCGPACLEAVLAYMGQRVDEATLRALSDTDPAVGTEAGGLVRASRALGLGAELQDGMTLEGIARHLAARHPVIAGVQAYGTPKEEADGQAGHWVVVTGYDASTGTVSLQDPARGPDGGPDTMAAKDFMDHWRLANDAGEMVERPAVVVSGTVAKGDASADWIAAKIGKLRSEGYDEKQAVAIAYSMAGKPGNS